VVRNIKGGHISISFSSTDGDAPRLTIIFFGMGRRMMCFKNIEDLVNTVNEEETLLEEAEYERVRSILVRLLRQIIEVMRLEIIEQSAIRQHVDNLFPKEEDRS